MTNIEIAQLISERIGQGPIPHNDIRNISYEIYQELGGESELDDFEDIYELLLTILPMAREGGVGLIDDTSIRTDKTWSSNKINSELSSKQGTLTAGENIDITNDTISAKGYKFNGDTNGGFAEKYKQDAADGGQVVENTATGLGSHAEGYSTTASGDYGCHAEGNLTQASGYVTHAEGNLTKASETASHAEGGETEAKANYSHAEGYQTKAIGRQSHAEGGYTKARGLRAHAEGEGASADNLCAVGDDSHTEGLFTQTQNYAEHAQGAANVSHKTASNAATTWQGDGNHTLHSIGNGRYTDTQSNAVEVMQNADVYIKGVGGYDGVHIKSEQGYETVKTLQQVISGKQDILTAGQNIVITNNTISAVIDAGFHVEVVQTLPTTGEVNTIYFVPKAGGANPDIYDEYMYINNAWEKIGSTEVDLSNYYNKTEVDTLLSGKQATLTAGNNITINGTTISANDTTYSASDNIDITNNVIKALGYRYNTTNGAFAEGDRDIDESGTIRNQSVATGVMAHAEGTNTKAIGRSSHAEGNGGSATGIQSHTEGYEGNAIGVNSHVEGRQAVTNGYASHAEGDGSETGGNYASETTNPKTVDSRTTAAGDYAHAEGLATIAYGISSHAEGQKTFAKGNYTHAEGFGSIALENSSHAEGVRSKVNTNANGSHTEGYECETGGNYTSNTKTASTTTNVGAFAHAEGNATIAQGIGAHSEGKLTFAKTDFSHAEGLNTSVTVGGCGHAEGNGSKVQGGASHAEGQETIASGYYSHSEGYKSKAQANSSHAEGNSTTASGDSAHSEGYQTKAAGGFAHAEGVSAQAYGSASHAEGSTTKTVGDGAHAEGYNTETGGNHTSNTKTAGVSTGAGAYAHAEGNSTIANGVAAHSEGRLTLAKGGASHAEGHLTVANGDTSHAEGTRTITNNTGEHAEGISNVSHTNSEATGSSGKTAHSIGIGTTNARKNAVEVMQNGDAYLLGVGNYDGIHIKGETGAPSGLQTLQEVVRGLKNISIRLTDNTTKTYQAKEGMTWFDWVNSDLNTDGFVVKQFSGASYRGYAVFESANSTYHLGFIFNGSGTDDYVPAACTIATSLSYYFYD